MIAGGIALLAVPARHWFGIKLGWREMVGLGLSASGLAFLALTATGHSSDSTYSIFGDGHVRGRRDRGRPRAAALGQPRQGRRHGGLLLGAAAGVMLGVSDVALKALADAVPADFLAIVSPWTAVAAVAAVLSFFALARSLQIGDAIGVIVVSSVAANAAAIVGGVLVFGDPMGSDALAIAARSAAFAAVIAAAALIPAAPQQHAQRPLAVLVLAYHMSKDRGGNTTQTGKRRAGVENRRAAQRALAIGVHPMPWRERRGAATSSPS